MRHLPILIGDRVPVTDNAWTVFLLLLEVMDIVFSPVTTLPMTNVLDAIVADHHSLFLNVSNYLKSLWYW